MSELRQRPTAARSDSGPGPDTAPQREPQRRTTAEDDHGISVLDIIRVIAALVLASCSLSYYVANTESLLWGYRPWFTRWPVVKQYLVGFFLSPHQQNHNHLSNHITNTISNPQTGPVNLTPTQLTLYNGTDPSLPIYLAVNGSIFDVSANRAIYGPGGSYNFFAGRDATRAFVTGCFADDLTPDLGGVEEMFLPVEDLPDEKITSAARKIRREREVRAARAQVEKTVRRWEGFFRNHKRYFEVGRVWDTTQDVDPDMGRRVLCEGARSQRPKRSEMGEGV